jgi:YD repeat-containing protein
VHSTARETNLDQVTSYTYTDTGLMATTTYHSQSGDVSESYSYDAFGNRTAFTNRNNNTFNYEYDQLNRKVRELSPPVDIVISVSVSSQTIVNQRLITEYDFDAFGNSVAKREAVGLAQERETRTNYDTLNRIVSIQSPS